MTTKTGIWAGIAALVATLSAGTVLFAAVEKDEFPSITAGANRQLSYGKELYEFKGRCISCHGWAGDGMGAPHSAGNAANLRQTKLDREQLIQIISCGVPGTAMPHFNAFAYSEDACYGMQTADIGTNIPPRPPRPLQQREIGVLVDYLLAKVIGRGKPSRGECAEFYGDSPVCDDYPASTAVGPGQPSVQ